MNYSKVKVGSRSLAVAWCHEWTRPSTVSYGKVYLTKGLPYPGLPSSHDAVACCLAAGLLLGCRAVALWSHSIRWPMMGGCQLMLLVD